MKKVLLAVSCMVMSFSMFVACGGTATSSSSASEASSIVSSAVSSSVVSSSVSSSQTSSVASTASSSSATSTAQVSPTASADLSSDIRSRQMQLDGVVYTFPLENVQVLIDNGWTAKKPLDFSIPSGNTTSTYRMTNSAGGDILISFYNPNAETKDVMECAVDTISIPKTIFDSGLIDIVLPGGFTGGSNYDEMVAVYGEPSELYEVSGSTYISYTINDQTFNSIKLQYNENKELVDVYYLLTRSA